jgi:hypothetical protein
MELNGHTHQYEAIAAVDIAPNEFITEYTGHVCYQQNCPSSMYCANLWYPDDLPGILYQNSLCIDAAREGNEARFINSVTPTTPAYIKQNASMNTVWCRNEVYIYTSFSL